MQMTIIKAKAEENVIGKANAEANANAIAVRDQQAMFIGTMRTFGPLTSTITPDNYDIV